MIHDLWHVWEYTFFKTWVGRFTHLMAVQEKKKEKKRATVLFEQCLICTDLRSNRKALSYLDNHLFNKKRCFLSFEVCVAFLNKQDYFEKYQNIKHCYAFLAEDHGPFMRVFISHENHYLKSYTGAPNTAPASHFTGKTSPAKCVHTWAFMSHSTFILKTGSDGDAPLKQSLHSATLP